MRMLPKTVLLTTALTLVSGQAQAVYRQINISCPNIDIFAVPAPTPDACSTIDDFAKKGGKYYYQLCWQKSANIDAWKNNSTNLSQDLKDKMVLQGNIEYDSAPSSNQIEALKSADATVTEDPSIYYSKDPAQVEIQFKCTYKNAGNAKGMNAQFNVIFPETAEADFQTLLKTHKNDAISITLR